MNNFKKILLFLLITNIVCCNKNEKKSIQNNSTQIEETKPIVEEGITKKNIFKAIVWKH